MKRALFTIADEDFATLLERASLGFSEEGIPYMFVGGIATQAHIASYICKTNACNLLDLAESHSFRLQDHLRATDDADITIDTRKLGEKTDVAKKVLSALSKITIGNDVYISPSGNHLVSIVSQRTGLKRPVFRLGLDADATNPDKETSFNIYHGPEDTNDRWGQGMRDFENWHYHTMMENMSRLSIPYSKGKTLDLNVKSAEDLLATKIARAREKDWSDILSLVNHSRTAEIPIDYSRVEALLCTLDPKLQVTNADLVGNYERFKTLIEIE